MTMELCVENLCVERGQSLILKGLSFAISKGEGLELRGQNGSGKTTLLRTLAGLLPKKSGEVIFKKDGVMCEAYELPQACHYIGDQNAMKHGLSVEDNLSFWQEFYGNPLLSIDDALNALGLLGAAHLPFEHLSKGQRRRIGLAKLLVSHRPIWLLDEPTSGLDANSDKIFNDLLADHLAKGGMALVASHVPVTAPLKTFEIGGQ